jgi:hypothetical protein
MYTLKLSTLIVYILLGAAVGAGVSQIIGHYYSGPEDCASLNSVRDEYHKPVKNSPSVSF